MNDGGGFVEGVDGQGLLLAGRGEEEDASRGWDWACA